MTCFFHPSSSSSSRSSRRRPRLRLRLRPRSFRRRNAPMNIQRRASSASASASSSLSKGLDVFGAVEELHNLSAKEMNKLLRDTQHVFTLRIRTGRGAYIRVNLEHLVLRLPLHLLACVASGGVEPRLRYLLRGVRLLHSLSDLAVRHPKLEQIFLQEVKIREQILDLVIYMLITLAGPEQQGRHGSSCTILHAALVACSLHLLPAFVAGEWSDLVPVLLVHPKVDIFMDATFDTVRRDIGLLQIKLRGLNSKLMNNRVSATVAESMAEVIGQQCEASIQVLQSLCQPDAFRDKVLNHKELCKNGGLLRLVLAVLKLQVPILLAESKYLVSLVARLKSKILSLMVKFCETEPVSFLDEVAADATTMRLAELVAVEVLSLVRNALHEEPKDIQEPEDADGDDELPSGLLYIHAMRLADIFSDDSNFRIFVMDFIAPDLAKALVQPPTIFRSRWCSTLGANEIKPGSDSVLIYDPFKAAGAAMHSFKNSAGSTRTSGSNSAVLADESSGCSLSAGQLQFASYTQERSALFVKILANLHCFNPEICPADEKDRFLYLFIQCLMVGAFTPQNSAFFLSTVQTAVRVCENLSMLIDHASSLPSEAVIDEDLQLVSNFYFALHDAICPTMTSEPMQEDPVVAYVRDAHEQKRKSLLTQWQKSERWKRVHLFEPTDIKEQSNGGSSVNRTASNSSSSHPNANDHDASEFAEEALKLGQKHVTKRKRDAYELQTDVVEIRKREHENYSLERGTLEKGCNIEEAEKYVKIVKANIETHDVGVINKSIIMNEELFGKGITDNPKATVNQLDGEQVCCGRRSEGIKTSQKLELKPVSKAISENKFALQAEHKRPLDNEEADTRVNIEDVRNMEQVTLKRSYNQLCQNEESKNFSMEHPSASNLAHMGYKSAELRNRIETQTTDAMLLSSLKSSVNPIGSAHDGERMNCSEQIPLTTYVAEGMTNGGDANVFSEKLSYATNATALTETAYCYKYRNREVSKEFENLEHKKASILQEFPVNPAEGEIISVKEISFELKLRADDSPLCSGNAKRLKADGHTGCTEHGNKDEKGEFVRLANVSNFVHVQHIQDISGIGNECSQLSAPVSLHVGDPIQVQDDSMLSAAGTFHVSGPMATQVHSTGETLIYAANNSQTTGIPDASRVSILEGSNTSGARATKETSEKIQPRIRKRNIMNHAQMVVMENALKTEPYMRRHPELIMQWTNKLNKMGPELSYQQLKNWLNNRKARLARHRGGEVPVDVRMPMYNHDTSGPGSSTCSGSSNDPNRSTSDDGANTKDSGSTLQTIMQPSSMVHIPQCKFATEDMDAIMDIDVNAVQFRSDISVDGNPTNRSVLLDRDPIYGKYGSESATDHDMASGSYSHRSSAVVKFVKCEAGQFVSLLDKDGKEAATGTLYQVEGDWHGKRIDEHGICIVKIVHLNVDRSTMLPHPSHVAGCTFEEAEKLYGQMIVAWDTKRIFLIS